jgi:hypothetical protein
MAIAYLKIIGRVTAEKTLKIRHSYMVQIPDRIEYKSDSPLRMLCVNEDGRELSSTRIPARPYNLPNIDSPALAVRAYVPIARDTRMLRFLFEGRPILDLPFGETPPDVTIDWKEVLQSGRPGGSLRSVWKTSTVTSEPLRSFYEYSIDAGRTWRRITAMLGTKTHSIDLNRLPGGKKCRLALVVTDGVLVKRMESPSFTNTVKPCVPMLFRPAEGAAFLEGSPIELIGQGFYREEDAPERKDLTWSSSKDGTLGSGPVVVVPHLSRGGHEITLTAGRSRRKASTSVRISVV